MKKLLVFRHSRRSKERRKFQAKKVNSGEDRLGRYAGGFHDNGYLFAVFLMAETAGLAVIKLDPRYFRYILEKTP